MKFIILFILTIFIYINSQAALFQFDTDQSLMVNVNNQAPLTFDSNGDLSVNVNNQLPQKYDEILGNLITITSEHNEIHEGEHYRCSNANLDFSTDAYWLFRTGNRNTHLTLSFNASKPGELYAYENTNFATTGDQIGCGNSKRTSTNTTASLAYANPTINDLGLQLLIEVIGTDGVNVQGGVGGSRSRGSEFILKQNTNYLIRYDPQASGTRASISISYYENGY